MRVVGDHSLLGDPSYRQAIRNRCGLGQARDVGGYPDFLLGEGESASLQFLIEGGWFGERFHSPGERQVLPPEMDDGGFDALARSAIVSQPRAADGVKGIRRGDRVHEDQIRPLLDEQSAG